MKKKILTPEEMATQGTEELVDATPIVQPEVVTTTEPVINYQSPNRKNVNVAPTVTAPITQEVVAQTTPVTTTVFPLPKVEQKKAVVQEAAPKLADVKVETADNPDWLKGIGATNVKTDTPTSFNVGQSFDITPLAEKDNLPLQSAGGNKVDMLDWEQRTPEQWIGLANFLNKAYNEKIPLVGSPDIRKEITRVWNEHQNEHPQKLYEQGYIVEKPKTKVEETAEKVLKEANDTGKSFLQLYQENIIKPQYDTKKAQAIAKSKNLALLSDIIRLIGEAATTSKGGVPIVRPTIIPALNAQLDKLNEQYKAEVRDYNQKGFQYLLMDEKEKRAKEAAKIQNALEIMKINQRGEKDKAQMELEAAKYGLSVKEYERKVANDKTNANLRQQEINKKGATAKDGDTVQVLWNGNLVNVPKGYYNLVAAKARKSKAGAEKYTTSDLFNLYAPEYLSQDGQGNWMIKGEGAPTQAKPTTKAKSDPLGLGL